jgi:hypothetical protein
MGWRPCGFGCLARGGRLEEVCVGVERDCDAGVAEHAADLGWVEPELDDQVAGEGVAQIVEAKAAARRRRLARRSVRRARGSGG